ncbi:MULTISPECIES: PH domain-containing protein [unclassified Haladaptatus]|uniref:PH domain-containing protein n=1 Tax=unclassified Haladaptatus TaxID=2622732 RepID=UPI00209BD43F|nr:MULTISPECIES: PH domain-containing protein [unclassified Haladaptatus]MCO8243974.1 PH domain-containing protein [Haladaptatus sp. AB643]MCO8256509.1 PH domain-containing protein [Haladaptatus sp. AB618]
METLNPRVRLGWLAGVLVAAALVGGLLVGVRRFVVAFSLSLVVAGILVVAVLGIVYVVLNYRAWRFEIRDDDLYLEHGVFTRVTTVVPFVRVQHVDTQRGPVERLLGLGSVVIYTAGSRGADVTIPGLTPERASELQGRLRNLAVESEYEDAV